MSRSLSIALNTLSVLLILAGVMLLVSILVPQLLVPAPTLEEGSSGVSEVSDTARGGDTSSNRPEKSSGDSGSGGSTGGGEPNPVAPQSPVKPEKGPEKVKGPEDKTLEVSVPEMRRVEDDMVPSTVGDDEKALKDNVAIHLEGTGFPWQEEANVYMAGHRIGYPGTDSFLGFYDLNGLEPGDKIQVTDSNDKSYTYRVYRQEIVEPSNTAVTEPVEGRNILTLQTCTLPNYTQRLIVQAEKVA